MPPFLILNSEYNNQISHNWKSSFSYISQQEQSHLTPIFGLSFIFYFSKQQGFRRLHKPDLTLTWKHTVYTIINQSAIVSSAIYTVQYILESLLMLEICCLCRHLALSKINNSLKMFKIKTKIKVGVENIHR